MDDFSDLIETINATADVQLRAATAVGVAGGDINQAVRIEAATGLPYFLKLNNPRCADMFAAEYAGLRELSRATMLRVPDPFAYGSDDAYSWLLMEWLELAPATAGAAAQLGQGVAEMHRVQADAFGWQRDNTIGRTPQINTRASDWCAFFADCRLGYQLELAARNGADSSIVEQGYALVSSLTDWFVDYQPLPSLLHGDLWGGNWGMTSAGAPVLFDPAVYYGDREADIAMTRLFGGFNARFYKAYVEAWPLDAGYQKRQNLYNLYHLLNHYNLFGSSYLAQTDQMLQSLLKQG